VADWGRFGPGLIDEAAHFWECPTGPHPELQEGSMFGKFLENDLPNVENSHISDDLINFMNIFVKKFALPWPDVVSSVH